MWTRFDGEVVEVMSVAPSFGGARVEVWDARSRVEGGCVRAVSPGVVKARVGYAITTATMRLCGAEFLCLATM